MKKIIIRFLQALVSNKTLFLKLKDTVFCNPAEHLYRTTNYARSRYSDKLHLPIIDVGAANGETARYFSANFPLSTVIGFEPIPKMFDLAQKTNEGNKSVIIKNAALSDLKGESYLNVTANYLSSSLNELNSIALNNQAEEQKKKFEVIEKHKIITTTLDIETKNFEEILLIKLDTQGTELDILRGGKETLIKTHLVLIEMNNHGIYKDGCQYFQVDQFLRESGFKLIDIVVVYRPDGLSQEYDAIYENSILNHNFQKMQ